MDNLKLSNIKGENMDSGNHQEKFYNRSEECKKIPDQINLHKGQRQIIILAGTSGVGKSCLAKKLLNDELANYKSVTVSIAKSNVNTIENLIYFDALYRKLNDLAKKRKEFKIKTVIQSNYLNPIRWLRFVWSAIKGHFGIDSETHICEPIEEPRISNKKQYILSVLKKGPFIVNVQNIQNIDIQSTELFQNISQNVPDLIWLLEYTTEEHCDKQFYSFCNEWNCVATPCVYVIKKLDFNLAFNLAPPEVQNLEQRRLIKAQYEKSHGNLLTIMVVPKNLDMEGDYIQVKLTSLSQDEKYIIYLMYLNETPIVESMLYSLLTKADKNTSQVYFSIAKATALLNKLERENIIKKQDGEYSIKHDTLITAISQMSIEPVRFLAYRSLEHHYQEIARQEAYNTSDAINHLFSLYASFHDERLVDLLPKIWDLIIEAKYPKEIIRKIDEYKHYMQKRGETDLSTLYYVTRFLTEICIRLQYPEQAQENLELIRAIKPSQYVVGLQGAIYALRSTKENLEKLDALIAKTEKESRIRLSLCLCRLRIMMRSCNSSKSRSYADELLQCLSYHSYPEYAFLLYNYAEFSETSYEALEYYQKALEIFEKYNMLNMQAEVNISMSMTYSYIGRLKEARKSIQTAMNLSPKEIPESVLLNNRAVIEILDGNISASVLNELADAALMDTNPYELLIIKSNWLVGLVLSDCLEQAVDLAEDIESSDYEEYKYEDFLHIVYQDLYFYYTKAENKEKKDFFEKKLVELAKRKGTNEGTRTLIYQILNQQPSSENFYSKFPFRVDFLGFWGLVISSDLENFE